MEGHADDHDRAVAVLRPPTASLRRLLEQVDRLEHVDDLDRVFRHAIRRQSQLATDSELSQVWLRRIKAMIRKEKNDAKQG